jgi:hypothetical protein
MIWLRFGCDGLGVFGWDVFRLVTGVRAGRFGYGRGDCPFGYGREGEAFGQKMFV